MSDDSRRAQLLAAARIAVALCALFVSRGAEAACDPATTCNNHGSCTQTGTCACFTGFTGAACQSCAPSYFNYPVCTFCNAATTCSNHGSCTGTGACACFTNFAGSACNACLPGFYGFSCLPCPTGPGGVCNGAGAGTCDQGFTGTGLCSCNTGFSGNACQYSRQATCSGRGNPTVSGGCTCDAGFAGGNCALCATNFYNYPACTFCLASSTCSGNGSCTPTGTCACTTGFQGPSCATAIAPAVPALAPSRRPILFLALYAVSFVALDVRRRRRPG